MCVCVYVNFFPLSLPRRYRKLYANALMLALIINLPSGRQKAADGKKLLAQEHSASASMSMQGRCTHRISTYNATVYVCLCVYVGVCVL